MGGRSDRRDPRPKGAEQAVVPPAPTDRDGGRAGVGPEDQAVVVGALSFAQGDPRIEVAAGELGQIQVEGGRGEAGGHLRPQPLQAEERFAGRPSEVLRPIRYAALDHPQEGRRNGAHGRPLAPRHGPGQAGGIFPAGRQQQRVECPGEAEDDLQVPLRHPRGEGQEEVEDLALRRLPLHPQQLAAQLVQLARAAWALRLVAHDVAAIEEAQGEGERREARGQEASQHRGEVGAQGQQLAVPVDEAVGLAPAGGDGQGSVGLDIVQDWQDRLLVAGRAQAGGQRLLRRAQGLGALEEERGDAGREGGGDFHSSSGSPATRRARGSGSSRPVIRRNCSRAWPIRTSRPSMARAPRCTASASRRVGPSGR